MDFDFTTETITPDVTSVLTIGGTGGVEISIGTTAERPVSPINGTIRYNTDDARFEVYQESAWVNFTDLLHLPGSTYKKIQDFANILGSRGIFSGGIFTSNGDGTIAVTSGTGMIHSVDLSTGPLYFMNFPANASLALTNNSMNYVYVDYNAGSPQVIAQTTPTLDRRFVLIGEAYREGLVITINNFTRLRIDNSPAGIVERFEAVGRFQRESGGIISATGTRNFAITAGVFWEGIDRYTTTAKNTAGSDTFTYWYRTAPTTWVSVPSQTQISNTQYNDPSSGLVNLSNNNRFGTHWVYLGTDGTINVVYGITNLSLTDSQDTQPPLNPPNTLKTAALIGRIIIQRNASTFAEVASAFDLVFIGGATSIHNELGGLQGGIADEYFHTTSAQNTTVVNLDALGNGIVAKTGTGTFAARTLTAGGGITVTDGTGVAGNPTIANTLADASTNTLYVAKYGNDTTGNGSLATPYLTIKKGAQVASTLGTISNRVAVSILNGIYVENNPIPISNEYVLIQGHSNDGVFVEPDTNGQALFDLSSGSVDIAPWLSSLILRGRINGGTPYKNVAGSSLVRVSGDGYYEFDQVRIEDAYTGLDLGNGTIVTSQLVEWMNADADDNNITADVKSSAKFVGTNIAAKGSTTTIQAASTAAVEINGFELEGNIGTPAGTGISLSGSATLLASSGTVRGFATGLLAAGTSDTRMLSTFFGSNTNDFNQSSATAVVQIQGVLSKTAQLITDGSNVSLNYVEDVSNDFIVGAAVSTGTPGKEFRVRDYDGRIAIGNNATDANIASGGVGGSRTLNLIDTNGNARIWRFVNDASTDPSIEIIKGINPANVDGVGAAPITSIVAGTDTITIDVSGTDYNDPLATPPGIDRTTLAGRAFPAGRIFQVNGTASNNGTFTVVSSTYNSGPQTISIVVTTDITVSEGAVGTAVFGGGAGRTDGPNPGNAAAAVAAGTGNVWWDLFLQESDYLVIRRRTGGGGDLPDEKVRIYADRTEILGTSTYDDADNSIIVTAQHTANAVNYITLQNSATTTPVLFNAVGTDTDVSISLVPKGAGVVTAGGTRGLVAPSGTTAQQPATPVNGTIRYNTTTSLMEFRQNGVWVNIGAGGVTTFSAGTTGFTPNTATSGAITLAGTLVAVNGGTGLNTYAIGDILYANTTTTLARLADIATGNALISGGVGVAPSWGKIGLTTHVTGILPLANGGSNSNLTAVNGGVVYSTASAMAITAAGTAGQVLTSNGAAAPTWQPAVSALQLYKENPSTPTAPSATGTNAVAILSGSSASATNAIAIGAGTAANANNIFAYANGNFATAGDAQNIIVMLRRNTADAVASLMYVDGSSQLLVLPNNSAWTFNIRVVGRRTDATGTWAMYTFAGGITRDASAATTTLRASTRTIIDESAGALNCTIAADTTNGSLNITVTGIGTQAIRWVATAEITQVTN